MMGKLKLSTFRIGSKRARHEGLRLGIVRLLPRGIRKQDYARLDQFDLWFPLLAPSRALLHWYRTKPPSAAHFRDFTRRYRKEIAANGETRQAIALLAALARQMPLSIGCYCDTPWCHRFLLEEMIRDAA
jgi:uncharacterized protein YeaO (DUF488 family)